MSELDPKAPLLLPEREPTETEAVLKGIAWFMAHPRVWALAAIVLAALCHFHVADHFQGWSGEPFQGAAQAHGAATSEATPYDPTTRSTP